MAARNGFRQFRLRESYSPGRTVLLGRHGRVEGRRDGVPARLDSPPRVACAFHHGGCGTRRQAASRTCFCDIRTRCGSHQYCTRFARGGTSAADPVGRRSTPTFSRPFRFTFSAIVGFTFVSFSGCAVRCDRAAAFPCDLVVWGRGRRSAGPGCVDCCFCMLRCCVRLRRALGSYTTPSFAGNMGETCPCTRIRCVETVNHVVRESAANR